MLTISEKFVAVGVFLCQESHTQYLNSLYIVSIALNIQDFQLITKYTSICTNPTVNNK